MKIMIENIGKSILIICFIFMFLLGIFIFKNDTLNWEKVFAALLIFAGVYLVSRDD